METSKSMRSGVKWVLISNALTFPAQYIRALILGRLSPDALGVYQIFRLLARVAPMLTMYGGQRLMMTLLPKLKVLEDRDNFIRSYVMLCTSIILTLVILFMVSGVQSRLGIKDCSMLCTVLICIFVFFICTKEFIGVILFALMRYKHAILAKRIPLLIITLIFSFFYIFYKNFFLLNFFYIILASFIIVGLVGTCIGIQSIRDILFKKTEKIFFPKGFWRIGLILFFINALNLLKADIDKYIVLAKLNSKYLGYYGACITIFLALRYFPQNLGSVFLVNFSRMIGTQQHKELQRLYHEAFSKMILFVGLTSIFVSSFSYYILLFYGKEYTFYAPVLALLSLRAIIIVPSLLNSPLILSGEKVEFRIVYDICELFLSAGTLFILASLFDLIGVALARILTGIIMEGIGIIYVKRTFNIIFPYKFLIYIIVQSLNCLAVLYLPKSISMCSILFLLSCCLLFVTRVITLREIKELFLILPLKIFKP